jgi:beta-N-acetylhexosaminidase
VRFFLLFCTLISSLLALPSDVELKKMIGHMLVVGFDDATINAQSPIVKELQTYELSGKVYHSIKSLGGHYYGKQYKIKLNLG